MSVFVPPPASEAGEIDEAFLGTVYDEGRMFALHNEDIAAISASSDPALASLRERLAEAQQRIERDRVIVAYAHTFGHQEHVVEIDANGGPFDFSAESDGSCLPAERGLARGLLQGRA